MLSIPTNLFEQDLTSWLYSRLDIPFDNEQDKEAITLLARLSKAQMKERNRGEEYLFIPKVEVGENLHWILHEYTQSENIQIRAYCKDVLAEYTKGKGKLDLAVAASEDYLRLYEKLHSPWFLLRSASVRSYKATKNIDFIAEVCRLLRKRIYPGWIEELSSELRRSYSPAELSELSQLLEEQTMEIKDPKHRHDERSCIEALAVIGQISKTEAHYRKALSHEGEVDYTKIINRELGRLRLSLNAARTLQQENPKADGTLCEIIPFLHFPPVFGDFRCREFMDLLSEYGVRRCYFGHIHSELPEGHPHTVDGIRYILCSADHLRFTPLPVFPTERFNFS